jgi:hypothetical protein
MHSLGIWRRRRTAFGVLFTRNMRVAERGFHSTWQERDATVSQNSCGHLLLSWWLREYVRFGKLERGFPTGRRMRHRGVGGRGGADRADGNCASIMSAFLLFTFRSGLNDAVERDVITRAITVPADCEWT